MLNYDEYLKYLQQTHATNTVLKEYVELHQKYIDSIKAELSNVAIEKTKLSNEIYTKEEEQKRKERERQAAQEKKNKEERECREATVAAKKRRKKFILICSIIVIIVLSAVIYSVEATKAEAARVERIALATGEFVDSRDKKKYKTIRIGNQVWMAENLNFDADDNTCYNNNPKNCEKYGKLYNWKTAKKTCPSGWHLPSDGEWEVLIRTVGGYKTAGKHLKAKSGWAKSGNCLDSYGFAALPGGARDSDGDFYGAGYGGYWWSASEDSASGAYLWRMNYDYGSALWDINGKSYGFSVRCLQD
jgi:uncharacterized protein (TIGR02145 family)